MSEHILGWIFGVAVAQGLFLVLALALLDVRNSRARWLLAALLLVLTLTLGEEFLDVTGMRFGLGVGLIAEFLMWPLLYLFVVSLAEEGPRPLRAQWWHLVPTGIAIAWYLWIYLGAEDAWMSLSNPEVRQQIALTVLIKALFFAFYAALILTRPLQLDSKPEALRRALRWVRRWLWFLCATYVMVLASFLAFYLRLDWAIDSDYFGGLVMVVGIYSLGYFTLANRNVFDVRRRRSAGQAGNDDAAGIVDRVRDHLTSTEAYLDPELGLRKLADALEVGESRLSNALNKSIDGGFYTLINDLRLEACRKLLDDPANDRRTVLELAYRAGFNSKATFYRYFRARLGMTPKAYRARRR
ncbi:MAG: helix-turn-helix transcriptional regulator [Xanthomonadales bacterium]|nr:helix-turn-helix transcriptional regulator [Xanthomonadales bacterium]